MAEQDQNQQFRCTGDCISCRAVNDRKTQWLYCAAQFAHNTMQMVEKMQQGFMAMQGEISRISENIKAIQDSEAMVLDTKGADTASPSPATPTPQPIAQQGDGALKEAPK